MAICLAEVVRGKDRILDIIMGSGNSKKSVTRSPAVDVGFLGEKWMRTDDLFSDPPAFVVRTGSLRRRPILRPNHNLAVASNAKEEEMSEFPCYLLQAGIHQWRGR